MIIEDKTIIAYCKRRGLPYDRKAILTFRRMLKNARKRAKDPNRKTLLN